MNGKAETAFQLLKEAMAKPLRLTRPRSDLTFVLQTDASHAGMSAVFYQESADGEKYVTFHVNVKLKYAERNYHINELGCYAAV